MVRISSPVRRSSVNGLEFCRLTLREGPGGNRGQAEARALRAGSRSGIRSIRSVTGGANCLKRGDLHPPINNSPLQAALGAS